MERLIYLVNHQFNIPEFRRKVTLSNALWLQKKLRFKNKDHKDYEEMMQLLKEYINVHVTRR